MSVKLSLVKQLNIAEKILLTNHGKTKEHY